MSNSTLSVNDIAQVAYNAGFRGDALVKATAIALAESGGRPDAHGDITLQDSTWGPSVGLWQVRSINKQYGTGNTRDATINTDPNRNAANAFSISNGGKNFAPWSTYTKGRYTQFLHAAQLAAQTVAPGNYVSYNATATDMSATSPSVPTTADPSPSGNIDPHDIGTQIEEFHKLFSSPDPVLSDTTAVGTPDTKAPNNG